MFTLMSFVKPEKWFLFVSDELGYQIEFPEQPVERSQIVNSEIGELTMNIFMVDASMNEKDDNLVYMVNHSEYPDSLVHSDMKEFLPEFFRGAIDGAVGNVHGKLLSEKIIQLGKYPGREVRIDFKNGLAVICIRVYLVENSLYMLQTITETNKDFNKSIKQFMNSFELVNVDSDKN